jgi:PKD repeat protein
MPQVQPITLRDIAAFRPAPGVQHMEPDGWVVPGLDANFFSVVDQQLVNGTLLAQPATVRFTPVGWHWNYGDGSAVIRATKGATWAAQGLHDFDRTATSHVYETEGEYTIRLTIDFHAEYRFGSTGFIPIAGTINLPANDLHVTVTGAKTVLVDHDCVANPAGPGC